MAIPNKIITTATAVLNKFSPFSDRLIISTPLTETSGTSFADKGHGTTYGGPLPSSVAVNAAGTGAISFGSDGARQTYVQTLAGTTDRANIRLYSAGAGGLQLSQGSFIVDFKDPGTQPASNRFIASTIAAAISGGFSIYRTATDSLVVQNGSATVTYTSSQWNVSGWNTLMFCWGAGRNWKVYLNRNNTTLDSNGGTQEGANTTAANMTIVASRHIQLGGTNTGGSGATYTIQFSAFHYLDKRLDMYAYSSKHINRILSDPWIYNRPTPDIQAEFSTAVCPLVSRPTETTATLNMVTGIGDSGDITGEITFTTHLRWRFVYGTSNDPTSVNHCNTTATATAITDTTDIITASNINLTGLSADITYCGRAEYTADGGTTWKPLPGGLQRFRTKRTLAGAWKPGLVTDDHYSNDQDVWDHADITNIEYGQVNYYLKTSRKALAFEKALQYMVLFEDNDFYIHTGDLLMTDTLHIAESGTPGINDRNDLLFYDMAVRTAAHRNFAFEMYADGAFFLTLGNHETENGFSQAGDHQGVANSSNGAYQALSVNIRKTYFPQPTNLTYVFGGENEGGPLDVTPPSWVPDVSTGIFATYDATPGQVYLTDYIAGSHANPHGLNTSPLENYFAFEWGGGADRALFLITDATRYTNVGDVDALSITTAGARLQNNGDFTRGTIQEAWIDSVYAASDAPWKFEIAHQHSGGRQVGDAGIAATGLSYGRGTGMWEDAAEHLRDHARIRQHRVTAKITGHDHRFAHCVKNTVNEIKLPTTSAPSHSGGGIAGSADGWHLPDQENAHNNSGLKYGAGFGIAESDGADFVTFGDGLGTASGNLKVLNVMGVATLSIGEAVTPILRFVRTAVAAYQCQTITQSGTPTTGTWTLTLNDTNGVSRTTAALAWNILGADLATAIATLDGIESTDIEVVRTGAANFIWTIDLIGNYLYTKIPTMVVDDTLLGGFFEPGGHEVTNNANLERNVGELAPSVSNVATLSSEPRSAVDAYLAADVIRSGSSSFWLALPTTKKGSTVGSYLHDEDRSSAAVTLGTVSPDQDVYVMAVPLVMYEVALSNAIPATVSSSVASSPAGSRATRLSISGTEDADRTAWEITDIANGTTFTLVTTSSGTNSGNVLFSNLTTLDIWLPPYHSYLVRTRQYDGEWGEWSEYSTFESRGPLNSFELCRSLNAASLTYANGVLQTDDIADECGEAICIQGSDEIADDNIDR